MLAGDAAGLALAVLPNVLAGDAAGLALAVLPDVLAGDAAGLALTVLPDVLAGDAAGLALAILPDVLAGDAAGLALTVLPDVLAVGGLPAQHGITAVDIAQIPLKAVTQRGGHGLGLQLVGGLGGSGSVAVADGLIRRTAQIVDIGKRARGAYHRANGVAVGFGHGDLTGAVAVGDAGVLHDACQTAYQILRGGDSAGVVHILDGGLLGIAREAAHIRAAAGDSAGVIAAGHRACVKLVAKATQILHAGHIALATAVGRGAVDQHTGQTAHTAGTADLSVHGHVNAGDHAGDIHIAAAGHHTGHVARIDGELAVGVHAALNRQVLDGGAVVLRALRVAEQTQI